jgi:tetratricopeptide (TPR) repeat protein
VDQLQSTPKPKGFTAWRQVALTVLTLAVVVVAIDQLWRLHQAEVARQASEERLAIATRAVEAGDVELARHLLASFAEEEADPAIAGRIDVLEQRLARLEEYQAFLARADAAIADGAHRLDGDGDPDPIVRGCEDTLRLYERLSDPSAPRAQLAQQRAAALMITRSLRLVLHAEGAEARRPLALVDQAEALAGPSPATHLLRSECQRRLGDLAAAERAANNPPCSADDYYVVGFLAEHLHDDSAAAAAAYTRALALAPAHYAAHLGQFTVARRTNDYPTQVTALTACLALRPAEGNLFFHRGLARFHLEDYPAALEDLNACLTARPEHDAAHYWRGRIHVLAARWKEADADFTAALAQEPKLAAAYSWRGLARARLGRDRDAVADAERAVQPALDADRAWQAACIYGLCTRLVRTDSARVDQYGSRTVALLREAVAHGWTRRPGGREQLRTSPDLDAVRSRRDFEDLLRRVETRELR